jgi:hypothetical protein
VEGKENGGVCVQVQNIWYITRNFVNATMYFHPAQLKNEKNMNSLIIDKEQRQFNGERIVFNKCSCNNNHPHTKKRLYTQYLCPLQKLTWIDHRPS